jgi:hypothetical protein
LAHFEDLHHEHRDHDLFLEVRLFFVWRLQQL